VKLTWYTFLYLVMNSENSLWEAAEATDMEAASTAAAVTFIVCNGRAGKRGS
jgi:hypothetical protein